MQIISGINIGEFIHSTPYAQTMQYGKKSEGPTSNDGEKVGNDNEKDQSRVCGLSLRRNLTLDGKFPEFTGRRFLLEIKKKLLLRDESEVKSVLCHRFTFCEEFGRIGFDWKVRDDGGISWHTALYNKKNRMMLVVQFDDSLKCPKATWCRRYSTGLARLDSSLIPHHTIIVSGHSMSQLVKRGYSTLSYVLHDITAEILRSAINEEKLMDRVFYDGSIQYLLPLPMGGVGIVQMDFENDWLFVPTTLTPKQAKTLLLCADPWKPRIPANRKQQKISGSVVA